MLPIPYSLLISSLEVMSANTLFAIGRPKPVPPYLPQSNWI